MFATTASSGGTSIGSAVSPTTPAPLCLASRSWMKLWVLLMRLLYHNMSVSVTHSSHQFVPAPTIDALDHITPSSVVWSHSETELASKVWHLEVDSRHGC